MKSLDGKSTDYRTDLGRSFDNRPPAEPAAMSVTELIRLSVNDWALLPSWFKRAYEAGNVLIQHNLIDLATPGGRFLALPNQHHVGPGSTPFSLEITRPTAVPPPRVAGYNRGQDEVLASVNAAIGKAQALPDPPTARDQLRLAVERLDQVLGLSARMASHANAVAPPEGEEDAEGPAEDVPLPDDVAGLAAIILQRIAALGRGLHDLDDRLKRTL